MQFTSILVAAAAASGVAAQVTIATVTPILIRPSAFTTQTVTAYITYCPTQTTFSLGSQTYVGTKSQWVTVTNCVPYCTISNPVGVPASIIPVAAVAPPVVQNGTVLPPPTSAPVVPTTTPCPCKAAPIISNGTTLAPATSNCPCAASPAPPAAATSAPAGSSGPAKNTTNTPSTPGSNTPVEANEAGMAFVAGNAVAALAVVAGVVALL